MSDEPFWDGVSWMYGPPRPPELPIADQPPPVPSTGDVWLQVIADMQERRKVGIERYGTPLQPFNGRNAPVDLAQELMDACAYARQWIEERRVLMAEVDRLKAENAKLRDGVNKRSTEIAHLKYELSYSMLQNTMLRDKARGDYWAWQGDGEDHLESLKCPVLISAKDLLAMQQQAGEASDATE